MTTTLKEDLEKKVSEGADLKGAHLKWAHLEGADLEGAFLERAHLEGAFLGGAHLGGAHLEGAHLEGANLDYSSGFSFRCSSFGAIIDLKIGAQMAYHFCRMETDDPEVKAAQAEIAPLANKFHRVNECGRINL